MRLALLALALVAAVPADAQPALIPLPAEMALLGGAPFEMTGATPIRFDATDAEVARVAAMLDALVGPSRGEVTNPPGVPADGPDPRAGVVSLTLAERPDLGAEGYDLEVTARGVEVVAATPAGLFYGVQTLRQLMPPRVEYGAALPRGFEVPAVRIRDRPRFAWRGMMLDVSRHFFGVEDVERVLDLMALHKLNRLHLHLSDDQGWRVSVPSRPRLTSIGGLSAVGGGPGGFYTVADMERIVAYAAERFITVIPEIDLPGHTNAALTSIAEINCDGRARAPYTGTRVGFSSVCVEKEETYAFVEDVVDALAMQVPAEVVHLGGDEVQRLSGEQYAAFMARAQEIVAARGKTFMGWDEIAEADLDLIPGSIVQVWRPQSAERARHVADAVAAGARLVLSPADRVYLDIKYDASTVLGLTWPGLNGVRDAYDWDPGTLVPGVPEAAVLGVEAPLWSETLSTVRDIEFMAFPRLAGVAELGWTPQAERSWTGYRARLGAFGPRWDALGVAFFRSPEVDWHLGGVE